jgi:hypothetical protein
MIDRRTALQIVAVLCATSPERTRAQRRGITQGIRLNPTGAEILELDFGAGALAVREIRLTQGALQVTVTTADLFAALQ